MDNFKIFNHLKKFKRINNSKIIINYQEYHYEDNRNNRFKTNQIFTIIEQQRMCIQIILHLFIALVVIHNYIPSHLLKIK